MNLFTSPDVYEPNQNINIFLAGGISNCPDWQSYIISKLPTDLPINIFNPRRKDWDIENDVDNNISRKQIIWEYNNLNRTDVYVFWFSEGSLNPITLLEYGRFVLGTQKRCIVGTHENYLRRFDVEMQTSLYRPGVQVLSSLDDIIEQLIGMHTYIVPNTLQFLPGFEPVL